MITLESLINNEIQYETTDISIPDFEVSDVACECSDIFNEFNTYESANTILSLEDNNDSSKLKEFGTKCVECLSKIVGKIVEFFKSVGKFIKNTVLAIFDKIVSSFKKIDKKDVAEKAQYLLENLDSVSTEDVIQIQSMSDARKSNIRRAIIKLEDALVQLCNSGKSGAAYMAAITENNNIKFIEVVAKEVVVKNDVMKKTIDMLAKVYEKAKSNPDQATNDIKDSIYGTGYSKDFNADNALDYKEDLSNGTSDALIHFNSTLGFSASSFEEIFIFWAGKACGISTNYTHPKNIHSNLSKILKNYSASAIPNNVIEYASNLRKVINSFMSENSKNIDILTKINNELRSGKIEGIKNVNFRRFFNIGLRYVQGSEMVMYKINAGLMKYYSNLSNYITMITDAIVSINLPERLAAA